MVRTQLAILLLLVVGCEKSTDSTAVTNSDESMVVEDGKLTLKTEEGTATIETSGNQARIRSGDTTMTLGGNAAPEGFPLAVMPGAKVEHGSHMTPAGRPEVFQVGLSTSADVEQIATFYEAALKNQQLSVTRSEQSGPGGRMVMLMGESDTTKATTMIVRDSGEEQVNITISWTANQ